MKILIIRSFPSYMNVKNNTYNIQEVGLAKALIRKGNICDIIFWTDKEEEIVEIPVEYNMKIHVFYKHGKTMLKNTVYTDCDDLFSKYDIIQSSEYNQMQSWILAKKFPQKIIIYHGPYFNSFNKKYNLMCKFFDIFFLRRYIKLGTKFITKSKLASEFLINKGIKETNIETIGVGIDVEMLSGKDLECKESLYEKMLLDSNLKLLYIGRFERRRNIEFILKVFKSVLGKNPNTSLYMIGSGNKDYIEEIWRKAIKMEIYDKIIYQEQMEQKYLSYIYKLADFFLLPTEYEIFGMVLLEAMYYKTVVLTTENGGSNMLFKNDINGCIIKCLDDNLWSVKICEISQDKDRMNLIKRNSHNTIKEKFVWDILALKFLDFYNILKNR